MEDIVHAREDADREAGFFEVIVGKGMGENIPSRRFGFVHTYDSKPKRRLYEMLMAQGMQMNQRVTFLSDGGDTVRDLQLYMTPKLSIYWIGSMSRCGSPSSVSSSRAQDRERGKRSPRGQEEKEAKIRRRKSLSFSR